ncbi:response regulator [Deferribacter autotrophicus]|uniref:Response regulator n=1 Tax=Deferribacter autotrophicus TaxID=500465 RepID=A0A5A8F4V3_9BACT|nr:response regulator [Deferribacter autotrophicus]KAA0257682.1 response regulator [Deferribacter autotrophicus]
MSYKILLVEDDFNTLQGLKTFLENEGFCVDIADNGKDAYTLLQDGEYSIVITDINMPFMDGLNFLSKIRNLDEEIPVVVITAYSNIENMVVAFDLGAVEFIEKPFDPDVLLESVKKILSINLEL